MERFESIKSAESKARYVLECRSDSWLRDLRACHDEDLIFFAICLSVIDVSPNKLDSILLSELEDAIRDRLSGVPLLQAMHDEYQAEKRLWQRLWTRERDRREALWKLSGIAPGQRAASEALEILGRIDVEDNCDPIGDFPCMTIDQLRACVPVRSEQGRMSYVSDTDIPEPWRERFSQASTGSTRYFEGAYLQDWLKFLELWPREMANLRDHRKAFEHAMHNQERN